MRYLLVAVILSFFTLTGFSQVQKFTLEGILTVESKAEGILPSRSIEKGEVNGIAYEVTYYEKGSTSIALQANKNIISEPKSMPIPGSQSASRSTNRYENWKASCEKDAIDDSLICTASLGDVTLSFGDGAIRFIIVGGRTIPGSMVALRVDEKPAIQQADMFRYVNGSEIIQQMKSGTKITYRFDPVGGLVTTRSLDITGFNEVLKYIAWGTAQLKK